MKQNCILLLIFSLFLFSCDNDDPVVIETNLPVTIPIQVSESSATDTESGQTEYAFTGSETYYLSDNDDLKGQIDDITYISSKGWSTEVTGLAEGDTINVVTTSIGDDNELSTVENVTNPLTGTAFPSGYATFGVVLMEEKQVTVTVEGTTNKAPMNFDVNFELFIEAVLADE